MEQLLQDIVAGRESAPLTIIYSDMHGLWGGVTVTLSASGAYERLERKRGAGVPETIRGSVAPVRVKEVVRLLIELKVCEQYTPERAPVPDESQATLVLRSGGAEASIWEWYNDLARNARLARVRSRLLELAAEANAEQGSDG